MFQPLVEVIPAAEVVTHPMSIADPNARLFEWDGNLYRGINHDRSPFFEHLFKAGIIDELIDRKLLVGSERVNLSLEPYGMIVQHSRLPVVTFPFEWSREMLRDAALLVLDLQLALLPHGLTLHDAHSWNVLWDGAKPVFVDLGSIEPHAEDRRLWVEQFRAFFIRPLMFFAADQARLARALMRDVDHGVDQREAALLTPRQAPSTLGASFERAKRAARRAVPHSLRPTLRRARSRLASRQPHERSIARVVAALRKEVVSITFPEGATGWAQYYDQEFPPFTADATWTPKHHSVAALLATYQPRSVLDIGANRGWYAQLAASRGAMVTAIDTDELCVDRMYRDLRANNLHVQPLITDAIRPWPGAGVECSYARPAVERLRSELVLALALTHHLVFKHHLGFDQIAHMLSAFASRALVVEFVPASDQFVQSWMTPHHDWYTLDNFVTALRRHWPAISIRPSHPSHRVLIAAERPSR